MTLRLIESGQVVNAEELARLRLIERTAREYRDHARNEPVSPGWGRKSFDLLMQLDMALRVEPIGE
jgi:hypothetical protein